MSWFKLFQAAGGVVLTGDGTAVTHAATWGIPMRTLLLFVALVATAASVSSHAATLASKSEVARYARQLLSDNYAADEPGAAVLVARGAWRVSRHERR